MNAATLVGQNPREPLMGRAFVTAAVGLVVGGLAVFGVNVSDGTGEHLIEVLVVAAPVVVPLVLAWWARSHVTPVAAPRNDAGEALVTTGVPVVDDVVSGVGDVVDGVL